MAAGLGAIGLWGALATLSVLAGPIPPFQMVPMTFAIGAAIGIVWAYMFDPRFGLLAQILGWVGISSPNWLNDPNWAMPAIIIVYVWKNLGFAATIFLAGL